MSELVAVTVDDRQVSVPKGTGLVEAAQAAGIEIPVFCYEPRLGAPVGACRMCLVEVEGMPKLQTGCTLTARRLAPHRDVVAGDGRAAYGQAPRAGEKPAFGRDPRVHHRDLLRQDRHAYAESHDGHRSRLR